MCTHAALDSTRGINYRCTHSALELQKGINFEIIILPNFNNDEVLSRCITELQNYFNIGNWTFNSPILLNELYINLDKLRGVQTVKDITIYNKNGIVNGYSEYAYDIDAATQNNVVYPSLDPCVFEVKYPNTDIRGRVVSL